MCRGRKSCSRENDVAPFWISIKRIYSWICDTPIFFTTLSADADDCRATDLIFLDQLQLQRVVDLQDVLQPGQQLDGVDSGKIALVVLVTSVAVVDDLFSDGIGVVV